MDQETSGAASSPKKTRRHNWLITAIVAVLCLVIGAGGMFWYLKYYEKDGKEKFTRGADGFFRVGNITDVDKLNDDYDEQYIKPGNSSVHIRYYKSGLKYPVMEIIGSYPIVYKRWSYEQSSGD